MEPSGSTGFCRLRLLTYRVGLWHSGSKRFINELDKFISWKF